MEQFHLSIYAADHVYYEGPCSYITIPTNLGQYGIMRNHRNTICAIIPGILGYRVNDGDENTIALVSSGMVKVEEKTVLVLVNTCENPEEIDYKRALRAKEEAQRELKEKKSTQEYYMAQANLARALNRLKVKGIKR